MPGFLAKQLCPHIIFIRGNKAKYAAISDKEFMHILKKYDPRLETAGLDEANCDMTDWLIEHNMNTTEGRMFLGQKIRQEVFDIMKMTCSVGISCNKMLAKIASEMDKPNGLTFLPFNEEKIVELMADRKVREVPGVGTVSDQFLSGLGIHTCKDLLENAIKIYITHNENKFEFLVKSGLGIARCFHEEGASNVAKKSISLSKSFKAISLKE